MMENYGSNVVEADRCPETHFDILYKSKLQFLIE